MRRDAEKDPQTNPNALLARHLLNQVSFNSEFSKYNLRCFPIENGAGGKELLNL